MGRLGRAVLAAVLVAGVGCAGTDGRKPAAPDETAATTASGATSALRCTPLPQAPTADEVAVAAQWTMGDTRQFTITRRRTDSANPSLDDASYTTDLRLTVTGVTAAGATMRWAQSGDGLFQSSLGSAVVDQMGRLADQLGDLTVDYSLDEDGQFEAVTNREAIRGYAERMIAGLKDMVATGQYADDGDFSRADFDRALEMMRPVMLSDQFIDTAVVQQIVAFHGTSGVVLPRYGSRRFDEELPNPYGGAPVAADASVEVLTDRDANDCVRIRYVVAAKPGALGALADSLGDIAGLDAAGQQEFRQSADDLALGSEVRYVYDPASGWPVRVEATKTIEDGERSRRDVTIIEAR